MMAVERPVDPAAGHGTGVGAAQPRCGRRFICYGPPAPPGSGGQERGATGDDRGAEADTAPVWPTRRGKVLVGAFGGQWLWQGGWPVTAPSESRDGRGASDNDKPFTFGQWRTRLTTMQQARLTIMRGYVLDYRAGIRGGAADGDSAYVTQADSGLWLAK